MASRKGVGGGCAEVVRGCAGAFVGYGFLGAHRTAAKFVYAVFFLLTVLAAWIVRDFSDKIAFSQSAAYRHCSSFTKSGGNSGEKVSSSGEKVLSECLAEQGVLRVSFGGVAFFAIMCLSTIGAKYTYSLRDTCHSALWPVKVGGWFGLIFLGFLLPSPLIRAFGYLAIIGSGAFIVIQVVIFVDYVYCLNEDWLSDANIGRCRVPLITLSLISYALTIAGIVLLYIWFVPSPRDCQLNNFFITLTLVICVLITCVSILPQVEAGPFTSGVTSLYLVFLCWSAITSESPHPCNKRRETEENGGSPDLVTVIGFVVAFASITIATFTAGFEYQAFTLKERIIINNNRNNNNNFGGSDHDLLPYNYAFFHLVFLTGVMYVAMLLLGWNLHRARTTKWKVEDGWTSTWVKMGSQWGCALLYLWTMIGPLLFKNRQFR